MAHLAALRCVNHANREAAALCSQCRKPHCRECVTEQGRLVLCKACLQRPDAKPHKRFRFAEFALACFALSLSLLSLVLLFGLLGKALLSIPAELHEGQIWRSGDDS